MRDSSAQHVIATAVIDTYLFRSLRRHPPPERAQQLSLHSECIHLLSEGKVVINIAEHHIKYINISHIDICLLKVQNNGMLILYMAVVRNMVCNTHNLNKKLKSQQIDMFIYH